MSITTSGNTIVAATNKDICIFEKPNWFYWDFKLFYIIDN